jgi:hypothetical protein
MLYETLVSPSRVLQRRFRVPLGTFSGRCSLGRRAGCTRSLRDSSLMSSNESFRCSSLLIPLTVGVGFVLKLGTVRSQDRGYSQHLSSFLNILDCRNSQYSPSRSRLKVLRGGSNLQTDQNDGGEQLALKELVDYAPLAVDGARGPSTADAAIILEQSLIEPSKNIRLRPAPSVTQATLFSLRVRCPWSSAVQRGRWQSQSPFPDLGL